MCQGAHNAGNDAVANLKFLICFVSARWRIPQRLGPKLFNKMIASIKGNWDVVEGGVDEEDDCQDAENET